MRTKNWRSIVNELKRRMVRLKYSLPSQRYNIYIRSRNGKVYISHWFSCAGRTNEKKLIESPQFGCDAAKENVKTPLFNLVGERIVSNIPQEEMDSHLMKSTEELAQSDRAMDAIGRQMARSHWLITPRKVHVQHYEKILKNNITWCRGSGDSSKKLLIGLSPTPKMEVESWSSHCTYTHTISD